MRSILLGLISLAALQLSAQEALQDIPESSSANILVDVQIIALPTKDALPLVRPLTEPKAREEALKVIDEKLAAGEAHLLGWPMVKTKSGQRAVTEDVREIRFITEYSTSGISITYAKDTGEIKRDEKIVPGTEFLPVPAGFETRSCGITMEVEPVLRRDGKNIDINIAQSHVRLVAMRTNSITREPKIDKVTVEQPEFDSSKVTTSVTVESGARVLLGVFPASEPKDYLKLFILRAEVQR